MIPTNVVSVDPNKNWASKSLTEHQVCSSQHSHHDHFKCAGKRGERRTGAGESVESRLPQVPDIVEQRTVSIRKKTALCRQRVSLRRADVEQRLPFRRYHGVLKNGFPGHCEGTPMVSPPVTTTPFTKRNAQGIPDPLVLSRYDRST